MFFYEKHAAGERTTASACGGVSDKYSLFIFHLTAFAVNLRRVCAVVLDQRPVA